MAFIIWEPGTDGFSTVRGSTKIKKQAAAFLGTTYPQAVCTKGGVSGFVEPAFDTAFPGQTIFDNFAEWQVTKKPGNSGGAAWHNLHVYSVGQIVNGSAHHVVQNGASVLQTARQSKKRPLVPPSSLVVGSVAFDQVQSRARRAWLSEIWKRVLLGGDRAAWVAYALNFSLANFDGEEKVYSGFELFQRANLGTSVPFVSLPDGQESPNLALPAYAFLVSVLPCPFAPAYVAAPHTVVSVADLGGGSFVITADSDFRNQYQIAPNYYTAVLGTTIWDYYPNWGANPAVIQINATMTVTGSLPGQDGIAISLTGFFPEPGCTVVAQGSWIQGGPYDITQTVTNGVSATAWQFVLDPTQDFSLHNFVQKVLANTNVTGSVAFTGITVSTPDGQVLALPNVTTFGGGQFFCFCAGPTVGQAYADLLACEPVTTPGSWARPLAHLYRWVSSVPMGGSTFAVDLSFLADAYFAGRLPRPRRWIVGFRVSDDGAILPSDLFSMPSYF